MPLDNAAKIYPSTASCKSPAAFRLAFAVNEPVRLLWLQKAVRRVMPRFPYFQVHLRRGFFWYYLQCSSFFPEIQPLRKLSSSILPIDRKTSPLMKISAAGSTIAIDFSHILTDGSGGIRFLLALASEYLQQAGLLETRPPTVMSPDEVPFSEEFEDAYKKHFPNDAPSPALMRSAWHLPGTLSSQRRISVITGRMPVDKLHSLARRKGVSITEYLAALYIHCLAEIHDGKGSRTIRLEVPVDMRRIFKSETLRNFSLYLSPEIDLTQDEWSFDEIASEIHHRIGLLKNRRQLGRQLHRNVSSELNPLIRFLPLFLKDILLSMSYSILGEGLHSGVLSNLGRIEVPQAMAEHIQSLHIYIVPNHVMKKSCTVLSYKGFLNITFTGVIIETDLERLFFGKLARSGIDLTVMENT